MVESKCPECNSVKITRDEEKGEIVCNQCGLILSGDLVDLGKDWRSFDSDQLEERSRTGSPMKYVKLNKGLVTMIDRRGTDLRGVDLRGTDLRDARILSTMFADVDLSSVMNLEAILHHGPSTIGIDTLFRSQGRIPEVFLRGCGVPEEFITHIPSLTANPFEFYSCFISYSHEDQSFARRLHDGLQGRGIRCWLDEKQLLPGDEIYDQVDHGVRLWDKVLLCASKHSLTSWWVDQEINAAFEKEQRLFKERGKKVLALIPLNLDGFLFSDDWQSGKKTDVLTRMAPDFTNWKHDHDEFESQLEQVIKALRTGEAGREPAPKPKL